MEVQAINLKRTSASESQREERGSGKTERSFLVRVTGPQESAGFGKPSEATALRKRSGQLRPMLFAGQVKHDLRTLH